FSREALRKLPAIHQVHELSGFLPGINVCGVKVQAILEVVTLEVGTDHVTFESQDGKFSACLTMKQAAEFGILVYEQDGAPFPLERGGPFRLIAPGLGDACANVKQVGKIIFSRGPVQDTRSPQACADEGSV